MGYINDPFIKIFVGRFQRRSPLINRGVCVRVAARRLFGLGRACLARACALPRRPVSPPSAPRAERPD